MIIFLATRRVPDAKVYQKFSIFVCHTGKYETNDLQSMTEKWPSKNSVSRDCDNDIIAVPPCVSTFTAAVTAAAYGGSHCLIVSRPKTRHIHLHRDFCGDFADMLVNLMMYSYPVEHKSRPLRSVDQSKNYTGYRWKMSATFGVHFRFLILLGFEIYGTQMLGNWIFFKIFACLNKPHDHYVQKIALKMYLWYLLMYLWCMYLWYLLIGNLINQGDTF